MEGRGDKGKIRLCVDGLTEESYLGGGREGGEGSGLMASNISMPWYRMWCSSGLSGWSLASYMTERRVLIVMGG